MNLSTLLAPKAPTLELDPADRRRDRARTGATGADMRWLILVLLGGCAHRAARLECLPKAGQETVALAAAQAPCPVRELAAGFESLAGWEPDSVSEMREPLAIAPSDYALDPTVHRGGARSLKVAFREDHGRGYAGALSRLDVSNLAGRTLTLSGYFRRSNPASQVGLWLRIQGGAYVNSYAQPFEASGWTRHQVSVEVPPGASTMSFGVAISEHEGVMWADDVTLSVD